MDKSVPDEAVTRHPSVGEMATQLQPAPCTGDRGELTDGESNSWNRRGVPAQTGGPGGERFEGYAMSLLPEAGFQRQDAVASLQPGFMKITRRVIRSSRQERGTGTPIHLPIIPKSFSDRPSADKISAAFVKPAVPVVDKPERLMPLRRYCGDQTKLRLDQLFISRLRPCPVKRQYKKYQQEPCE